MAKTYITIDELANITGYSYGKAGNIIRALNDELKEKGLSSGTMKQVKSILNMMFNYALKNEYINKNMVEFLDIGKFKKVIERKVFTNEEINILWNNKGKRDIDIILILIYTGLRVNELLTLENSQINIEDRYIKAGSKTEAGKDRLIPLNYKILPLILRYVVTDIIGCKILIG